MSGLAIKIGFALLSKVMTETFISRTLVYCLRSVSQSTSNKLDDQMVSAVADALGVPESK